MIRLTKHAVHRYVDRVRPGLELKRAEEELSALVEMAGSPTAERPAWKFPYSSSSALIDRYLELSDGVCLGLVKRPDCLLGMTVFVRCEQSDEMRAQRRKRKAEKRRAKRTSKRSNHGAFRRKDARPA